jgi:uncharacterized coiled-coil DUF342 family protein
VPDEISLGEVVRRLDRIERQLQDLSARVVSSDVYTRDQREIDRRLTELERDLADKRKDHAADVKELRGQIADRDKTGGSNFRQNIFQGWLPAVFILVGILVQIGLALRGGK